MAIKVARRASAARLQYTEQGDPADVMRPSEGLGGDLLHSQDHEPTGRQPSNRHESRGGAEVPNHKVTTEDLQVGEADAQRPQDTYP